MSFFASKRERKLWIWTLVIVLTVFSTLGLAAQLANVLQKQRVIDQVFVFSMFLIGIFLVTQGLRVRPHGIEVGIVVGVFAGYTLLFARMASAAERSHLIEYGLIAGFIFEALLERRSKGRSVKYPWLLAILASTVIGWLDECVQSLLPNRYFAWVDVLFDLIASIMAVVALVLLQQARGYFDRPERTVTGVESKK